MVTKRSQEPSDTLSANFLLITSIKHILTIGCDFKLSYVPALVPNIFLDLSDYPLIESHYAIPRIYFQLSPLTFLAQQHPTAPNPTSQKWDS
jgi:hypothetical protein